MTTHQDKPFDAKLASILVGPLRDTGVTPNHLTTLRLSFGVLAGIGLARGDYLSANLGSACFALSNFLDHADGELSRLSGKTSRLGHYYDLSSDALVNILMFWSLGVGLAQQSPPPLGNATMLLGAVAGAAVAFIFHVRDRLEKRVGRTASRQPHAGNFEAEDVLYLLPLVTLFNLQLYFLSLAALGAPLFAVYIVYKYRSLGRGP